MREAASFIANQSNCARPAGVFHSLLNLSRHAFRSWTARRKLVRLIDMDDHLLADIGVTREDLNWAVQLPFSYDPSLELQRRALRNRAQGWRC